MPPRHRLFHSRPERSAGFFIPVQFMTTDQATKIVSKYEPQVVLATYNILFTNDIVCGEIIDAFSRLEKSPLFRQRTKQLARQAVLAQKSYERLVNEIISDRCTFFADANETFAEEVNRHVQILYWSIKREMDKHNVEHSDVLSKLETARTLCDFACQQFDKRLEELKQTDRRFSGFHLDYLRLTNLLRLMNELMRTFYLPCLLDFNTPECLSAIDILAKKLVDADRIARAISV